MGLVSDIVGGFTGGNAADAAKRGGELLSTAALEGADIRALGGQQAFNELTRQLSPFAGQFSSEDIAGLNELATSPEAQVNFLENNPLFDALRNQAREATFRTQSAGGALGSSGTDEILQNQFLALGNDLITQQIKRQLPLLQGAQQAGTQLGIRGSGLLSGIADVLASGREGSAQALATGKIGEANAKAQGVRNLVNLGSTVAGGFF